MGKITIRRTVSGVLLELPLALARRILLVSLVLVLTACRSGGDAIVQGRSGDGSVLDHSPYAVGSTTRFIHDDERPFDAVGGVDTGVRTLITEIWYPVSKGDILASSVKASHGDYAFGNRSVHEKMLTETIFRHLDPDWVRQGVTAADIDQASNELFSRTRGSYVDLPVAKPAKPFPVVLMSHGDAGSRFSMETVCEALARQGYIVVAPEHTGNSPYSMIGMDPALASNDGDPIFKARMAAVLPLLDEHGVYGHDSINGQSYSPLRAELKVAGLVQLDRSLVERVNDLRAVLGRLEQMNRQGQFTASMDLSHVGLMGRSFGAATTLAGLMLEPRFTSGFAVVPPSLPDMRSALPAHMLVSGERESVILSADAALSPSRLYRPTALLSGAEDDLILGKGYQLATITGTTLPSESNPYPLLKYAFDNAEVPAVMSIVDDTNHGSFGVAAPYWWPELKPNTFPRFFDPDSQYQLLDADIAHRIQQQMVLAFFELTLKNDASQLEVLHSNPWKKYGTSIELRGFDAYQE